MLKVDSSLWKTSRNNTKNEEFTILGSSKQNADQSFAVFLGNLTLTVPWEELNFF